MRRLTFAAAIALAAAASATAAASAGSVSLRSFVCHRALDPTRRTVSVTAAMGTVPGTEHLQMRFQLLRRSQGTATVVRGGDLGRWISPNPLTLGQHPNDVWIVRHPVTGVPVPGSYRFRVAFRWRGAGGHTLGQAQLTSNSCWQPDMRPDLWVRMVSVNPVSGGDRYVVDIGNAGLTAATTVGVAFAPGGGAQTQTITIPRLRSHATATESFTGPVCSVAAPPTVTVDPDNRVNDLNRANNSLTVACP